MNRLDNQSSKRGCIDRPITGAQRRDKRRAAAKYGRIKDYGEGKRKTNGNNESKGLIGGKYIVRGRKVRGKKKKTS